MSRRPDRTALRRFSATLPPLAEGLCLLRFGIVARGWSGRAALRGLARDVDAALPTLHDAGLLHADRLDANRSHAVWLLYWRDFAAVESWARRDPHTEWWRRALDRMRRRGDLGVYHEAFVVPRAGIESIYLDCPPLGLLAFGTPVDPSGPLTTAQARLTAARTL